MRGGAVGSVEGTRCIQLGLVPVGHPPARRCYLRRSALPTRVLLGRLDAPTTVRHHDGMAADDLVEHIPPEARIAGDPTPGMVREQAISSANLWAGVAHTEAGMVSGWHHHGEYESVIFVVSGRLRMESGPGGESVIESGAGHFLRVPPGAVHRESNPGDEASQIVVIRSGRGQPTFNVDGPAAQSAAM